MQRYAKHQDLAAAANAVKFPLKSRYGVADGLLGFSSLSLVIAADTCPKGQVAGIYQGWLAPAIATGGLGYDNIKCSVQFVFCINFFMWLFVVLLVVFMS